MIVFTYVMVQLILMISFMLIPFMSKKDVVLGVKIPTGATDDSDIRQVRKNYLVRVLTVGVLLVAIQFLRVGELASIISMCAALILYSVVYILAYRQMKYIKGKKDWKADNTTVIDTAFRQKQLILSPIWYLGYLAIFLASVVLVIVNYESLPDMLRMQVDSNGNVTSMMTKDRAILFSLGMQVAIMLLMVFVQVIIKKAKQDLSASNTLASIENSVKFRYVFSIILYVLGLVVGMTFVITLMFSMEIIQDMTLVMGLLMGVVFIAVIVMLVVAVRLRQDGSNRMQEKSEVIEKDDDRFWKLGVFYFNANDPSVFVSKRVSVGWTVNHARWQAWVMYLVLLGFVVGTMILSVG